MKPVGEHEPVSQSRGQRIAGLSLDIADYTTEPAAKLPQLPSHPSELSGVRAAVRLLLGARPGAGVALAQLDSVGLGLVGELLARPVQKSAIRRMRDRTGLHRRVHHDRRQARLPDRAGSFRRLDRLGQQLLDAFLADRLAPLTRLDASQGTSC